MTRPVVCHGQVLSVATAGDDGAHALHHNPHWLKQNLHWLCHASASLPARPQGLRHCTMELRSSTNVPKCNATVLPIGTMVMHRLVAALHGSTKWLHCGTMVLHNSTTMPHGNPSQLPRRLWALRGYPGTMRRNPLTLHGHDRPVHNNAGGVHARTTAP